MLPKAIYFRYLLISLILGLVIGSFLFLDLGLLLGILTFIILLAFLFLDRKKFILFFILAGAFLIGFIKANFSFQLSDQPLLKAVRVSGGQKELSLFGRIISEPKENNQSQSFVFETLNPQNNKGEKIYVTVPRFENFRYQDEIILKGKISLPSSENDYWPKYLAKDNIYLVSFYPAIEVIKRGTSFKNYLYAFKENYLKGMVRAITEPSASFISGLFLGTDNTFEPEFKEDLRKTGLSHLTAVSGYNLTLVADLTANAFKFLSLPLSLNFILVSLFIILFSLMVGSSASVNRAAIMALIAIIAKQISRFYQPGNAVLLAGASMLFLNPKIFRFDLGFQLSFLATLGLIYFSPFFERILKSREQPGFCSWRLTLAQTLAVLSFVLPYLLAQQSSFSLISPLANFLVLPLIPLVILGGLITGFLSFLFMPLAQVVGLMPNLLSRFIILLIEKLADWPYAYFNVFWPPLVRWLLMVIAYLLIIGLIVREQKRPYFYE